MSRRTYDEVAVVIADVTGLPLKHRSLAQPELTTYLELFLPAATAERMTSLDRIVATGGQARITGAVEAITGRPPRTFREWVSTQRPMFAVPA